MQRQLTEKRFWSKVDILGPNECWLFNGCRIPDGYGAFRFMGKPILAHRVAWMIERGIIPEGLCVCHTCDVRLCCNPSHLFIGTRRDNTRDCIEKKRFPFTKCGDDHPSSKLTSSQVMEIRKRYSAGGITCLALGNEYKVTDSAIMEIIKRHVWKHI